MTDSNPPPDQSVAQPAAGPSVDAGRLWAGGLATAIVAALIADRRRPHRRGVLASPWWGHRRWSALGHADRELGDLRRGRRHCVATGLLHILILPTPRPMAFFSWIVGLGTVAAVAVAVHRPASRSPGAVASAIINAVIGLAILSILARVAAWRPSAAAA